MKKVSYLVVLMMICSSSFADEKVWPEGSAMSVGSNFASERDRYQSLTVDMMDIIYSKLEDQDQVRAIENQTSAFDSYMKAACRMVGVSTGSGGTWQSTHSIRCERGLAYDRYFATKNALRCIDRSEKSKYVLRTDRINCLIQTLNVKLY
ncbi:hypothetical protein ACWU4D_18360 [Vibrio sp. WJH972]